jgi:phospholipase C
VQFERQSRRSVGIRHHLDVNTRNGSGFDRRVRCPGFARYFKGSIGSSTATLDVASGYGVEEGGPITWTITNVAVKKATVSVLDAYSGNQVTRLLQPNQTIEEDWSLSQFHAWYDLIVTVAEDSTFEYLLAGHVETGRDSFSDPALGGLVTLQS